MSLSGGRERESFAAQILEKKIENKNLDGPGRLSRLGVKQIVNNHPASRMVLDPNN